jgi:hypothetical protein
MQVDRRVPGQQLEHVVKETDTGLELGAAGAVQIQLDDDVSFAGAACDFGCARHVTSSS